MPILITTTNYSTGRIESGSINSWGGRGYERTQAMTGFGNREKPEKGCGLQCYSQMSNYTRPCRFTQPMRSSIVQLPGKLASSTGQAGRGTIHPMASKTGLTNQANEVIHCIASKTSLTSQATVLVEICTFQ